MISITHQGVGGQLSDGTAGTERVFSLRCLHIWMDVRIRLLPLLCLDGFALMVWWLFGLIIGIVRHGVGRQAVFFFR